MSSIYKKGRDGYFYYQTYVYNTESKKKDKRIFHALGTKDLVEAEKLKEELDEKYKSNTNSSSYSLSFPKIFYRKIILVLFFGIVISIVFVLSKIKNNDISISNQNSFQRDKLEINKIKNDSLPFKIESVAIGIDKVEKAKFDDKGLNSDTNYNQMNNQSIVSLPEYSVVRVEKLSSAFDQIKIYATVSPEASDASQRSICEALKIEFSEFSNILICMYSSDLSGMNLANGFDEKVSLLEKQKAWLSLFSFNEVEGPYFDSNPGRYLGFNN